MWHIFSSVVSKSIVLLVGKVKERGEAFTTTNLIPYSHNSTWVLRELVSCSNVEELTWVCGRQKYGKQNEQVLLNSVQVK